LIPRAAWTSHPNYPEQVLLLGSHQGFRDFSAQLIELARAGHDLGFIEANYRRWIAAMRSHEAYEERKLFPYLTRRCHQDFSSAQSGHDALHDAHDVVLAAFEKSDRDGCAAALVAHDRVLREHLELEENLVIPLLLAMPRDEFQSYSRKTPRELMRSLDERGL